MGDTVKSATFYPLFLKVKGKRCVVIGGGEVALRKTRALLEYGANIEVVSPALDAELRQLASDGIIRVSNREFQPSDLEGALIAIAATDDLAINKRVTVEARQRGTLVNVVDNPELCDFIVPSGIRRGDLAIAISTGGKSPALSRKLRMKLETLFGEEYAVLADVVAEVRSELKARGKTVSSDRWQQALDLDRLVGLVKNGQKEEARSSLLKGLI